MNKKFVLSVFGIATLLGLFTGGNFNIAYADNAVSNGCTSETLFGTVTPNGATTSAWFEWGPTTAMQYSTPVQTFNTTSTFSQTLSPLPENTTFYWRAMASNVNGTATGNMLSFTTASCTQNTPSPTVTISADQTNIPFNGSTTIRWSSNNATSCMASGGTNGWSGTRNLSGSFNTGVLTNTTTYSINCSNNVGSDNGSVTVVVGNQPLSPTVNLTADLTSIPFNGSTTLRWNSSNATFCSASGGTNGWSGTKNLSGSFFTGALTTTTTYSINCSNNVGSDNASVTVFVGNQPAQLCQDPSALNFGGALPCVYQTLQPTVSITADQTSVVYNGGTIIRWNSTNTVSCNASSGSNGWSGLRNTSGSFFTGQLIANTAFNITCSNANGSSASGTVIVNVGNQPIQTCQDPNAINFGGTLPCRYQTTQVCQDPNALNFGGALPCQYSNVQPNVTLTADDTNINFDDSTVIRWFSNNANFCTASGGTNGWSGSRNTSGSFATGSLTSTRIFSLTCSNNNGGSASDSVTIFVNNNNSNVQPSVNISADDTNINFDDSTRIRWNSNDADECRASGGTNGWSGTRGTSGTFNTGSLTSDETYRITCTNDQSGETDTDSVTVFVDNNNNNFNNRPSVSIFADRTNIAQNESTIIRWYPNDADSCNASGGANGWSGWKSTSGGSFNTGSIFQTTTYYINCSNSDGSANDSVTVYVNNNNNINYYTAPAASAPTAVTTTANQLSDTTAQLNSLIFSAGSNTNAWFEWGPTASLGNSTNPTSIGSVSSTTHSDTISGLVAGTTYYFRAAAENAYFRNYGNTMSFTMTNLGGSVAGTSTIINRPTTIINQGTQSLVMLTIDGGSENIAPLERRNYEVSWKNISNQTLSKVVLRIILPQSLTFESTNRGSFSSDDNTLTLDLGSLNPGEAGNTFLLASAKDSLKQGELIVSVANLVYTDRSNAQGEAVAYATQRADLSGSVLGANAFGAGFLPSTFLGWLLLLILLLIIILLSRYLYNQSKGPTQPTVAAH